MSGFKSDFLHTLSERGFIHQISDETGLDELFRKETVTAYIGFDPTAPSLHAGGLIQIMMLHWMQATGHRPISLMGGGTGMVGDPSFKDEARQLMTPATIDANIASIKTVFSNYLSYGEGPKDALMINNADWLLGINYLEFLRDVGRHFSVNRMLSFDSVKTRLDREQSLSFLEFNYMILQAYDFVELHKRTGCRLQMGLGPVGQHHQRHRPRPPHGHRAALCPDLAASDHLVGRKDGQVGQRRHLAEPGHAVGL